MTDFPYRPRAPRHPPEAPEVETPQQSDSRFLRIMLRIGGIALLVLLVGAAMVGARIVAPIAGVVLITYVIFFLLFPGVRRATFWVLLFDTIGWPVWLWWSPFRRNEPEPRKRDPHDIHRGDHLL